MIDSMLVLPVDVQLIHDPDAAGLVVDEIPTLALLAAVAHSLTLATHDQTSWRCTAGETTVLHKTNIHSLEKVKSILKN